MRTLSLYVHCVGQHRHQTTARVRMITLSLYVQCVGQQRQNKNFIPLRALCRSAEAPDYCNSQNDTAPHSQHPPDIIQLLGRVEARFSHLSHIYRFWKLSPVECGYLKDSQASCRLFHETTIYSHQSRQLMQAKRLLTSFYSVSLLMLNDFKSLRCVKGI
jgi:hypothetical protein